MAIEKDLLDQLLAGRDPKDVFNKDGLVDELKKALSERILNTELDEHLDDDSVEGKSNHRNGYSKKSVLTGTMSVMPLNATKLFRRREMTLGAQIGLSRRKDVSRSFAPGNSFGEGHYAVRHHYGYGVIASTCPPGGRNSCSP
jgi:hypothetical protein